MRWNATCANCHKNFTSINDYSTHECEWKNANKDTPGYQYYKEEKKMTVCTDKDCSVHSSRPNSFKWNGSYWQEKEQPKMTKSEAINKVAHILNGPYTLETLEALGLLKFDEPKKEIKVIIKIDEGQMIAGRDQTFNELMEFATKLTNTYGVIRLEEWPEGLVLWVGGEIKWKSWEPDRTKELARKLAGEVKIKVTSYDFNVNTARGRIVE